jgi:hypothetical protein
VRPMAVRALLAAQASGRGSDAPAPPLREAAVDGRVMPLAAAVLPSRRWASYPELLLVRRRRVASRTTGRTWYRLWIAHHSSHRSRWPTLPVVRPVRCRRLALHKRRRTSHPGGRLLHRLDIHCYPPQLLAQLLTELRSCDKTCPIRSPQRGTLDTSFHPPARS